ncbi:DUF7669 domain-containing protein [Domibacillus tundrae]|uniref:DUF7669 domain-containing protein n=1 Tax=Domibacillus tundrae TaxID=1587527 RepID=UPI00061820B5|nr:hypothetical protein [Domibacillus tundrae]
MKFGSCREEVVNTVKIIINQKGKNEFTIKEVVQYMLNNNTAYKVSTISTHISSRCCTNSPNHHGSVYNDFQRIKPGLYKLVS